jgi:hypothetical protein
VIGLGSSSFSVRIQSSETVYDLKKTIVKEKSHDLASIDADRLTLYKVELDTPDDKLDSLTLEQYSTNPGWSFNLRGNNPGKLVGLVRFRIICGLVRLVLYISQQFIIIFSIQVIWNFDRLFDHGAKKWHLGILIIIILVGGSLERQELLLAAGGPPGSDSQQAANGSTLVRELRELGEHDERDEYFQDQH